MRRGMRIMVAAIAIGMLAWSGSAEAQTFAMQGLNRVSFGGTATLAKSSNAAIMGGMSRFTNHGIEIGGDVTGVFSSNGATGFAFGRASKNFPGASLFVPFVTGGIGAPFGQGGGMLYEAGGGLRRFTTDRRSSMDVTGTWQRAGSGNHLGVRFGLSYYFGGQTE